MRFPTSTASGTATTATTTAASIGASATLPVAPPSHLGQIGGDGQLYEVMPLHNDLR